MDKCPKCGAPVSARLTADLAGLRQKGSVGPAVVGWKCGRRSDRDEDTLNCLRRQHDAAQSEIKRLHAEIERLYEELDCSHA